MEDLDFEKVTTIGAGEMGQGIAEVFAIAGFNVTIHDIEKNILEKAIEKIKSSLTKLREKELLDKDIETVLNLIETTTDLEEAVSGSDFVIEAVPEKMDLKKEIFSKIDEFAPEHAILASNTSSLSISEMGKATERPEKVVGMHWFNPPVMMDLVEVIYGEKTSEETAEITYGITEKVGKTPIYCRKDVRGFIVNNVLMPYLMEPIWMMERGEANMQEADAAMVYQLDYPMGPFELIDMTGIDPVYHIHKEAGEKVPSIMEEKIEKEELGQKTGKGFYDYEEGEGANYEKGQGEDFDSERIEAMMINEAARLIQMDVTTPEEIDTGMELGTGFPEGPCKRADKIGLDKVLEKMESLYGKYGEERYKPVNWLREKVKSGETGKEAEAGFYEYGKTEEKTYHTIKTEGPDERGTVNITLDRPSRLNALNEDMIREIPEFVNSLNPDNVNCIVVEGKGDRAFSAGADIKMLNAWKPHESYRTIETFNAFEDFPAPVIAKIDGLTLGGGLELALSCDLRIASEKSEFGQPEIKLGLIPGGGGTQRLLRLIGEARAKELVFRGDSIDAEKAENWGLINKAVPRDKIDETVEEYVNDMVEGPPIAMRIAKRVINKGRDQDLQTALNLESEGFGLLLSTEDAKEGMDAFQQDRDPEFEGK